MSESFIKGWITLHCGDCSEVINTIPDNSIDSIVTDPPYALVSIQKRFGAENAAPAKSGKTGAYARASKGFMGKNWDTGAVAFDPEFWKECLRVLKPGGHLLAFGGTRTYHRLACSIEDAGFEVRDMVQWLYGTGFPKNHDAGNGWGTALKPANEPICLARKQLSEDTIAANVLRWGTGALNIGACRVGDEVLPEQKAGQAQIGTFERHNMITTERIGRWPANIVHDGSDEVVGAFPKQKSGGNSIKKDTDKGYQANAYGKESRPSGTLMVEYEDKEGSAARFFYSSKADAEDRLASKHPTVKPVDLMQWLIRLITPKNGIVLDPFAGTGTTAEAAFREGFKSVIIEREPEYQEDIRRRMELVMAPQETRKHVATKNKKKPEVVKGGSFFKVNQ